jgi:hypothetical protein
MNQKRNASTWPLGRFSEAGRLAGCAHYFDNRPAEGAHLWWPASTEAWPKSVGPTFSRIPGPVGTWGRGHDDWTSRDGDGSNGGEQPMMWSQTETTQRESEVWWTHFGVLQLWTANPARPVTAAVLVAKVAMVRHFSSGWATAGLPPKVVPHRCGCPTPSREGGRRVRLAGNHGIGEEKGAG